MLGLAWLTFRQTREALQSGRLEEAKSLLELPVVQGHRRLTVYLTRLARAYLARGERKLDRNDVESAWFDLLCAEQLGIAEPLCVRFRHTLTRVTVAEIRGLLMVGEVLRSAQALARLKDKGVCFPEQAGLEEGIKSWLLTCDLADLGDFHAAHESLERTRRLLQGNYPALDRLMGDLDQRRQTLARLTPLLHASLEAGQWGEVIERAEEILEVAPKHPEARWARSRGWKAVEPVTVAMGPPIPSCKVATLPGQDQNIVSPRYLLWIDGVGAFLLCLGTRISLGKAGANSVVEVPLGADISRLHANLTRDSEGYTLDAFREVQVNGSPTRRTLLRSGDRLTLGTSCQLLFRLPVSISLTARLDVVSGHRLPLAIDAIFLMADTLIMGPELQSHIAVPNMSKPVVLFRQKESLGIRHPGEWRLNGSIIAERALLTSGAAQVDGESFSFALEPVISHQ